MPVLVCPQVRIIAVTRTEWRGREADVRASETNLVCQGCVVHDTIPKHQHCDIWDFIGQINEEGAVSIAVSKPCWAQVCDACKGL